ncbi:MAG: hypothetical protein ACYCWW_13510 [Deltaproteobacteria bacterium]
MFRLVRWLLLMSIIAALAAFLLTWPIAGATSAERVCGLADSPLCLALAARGRVVATQLEAPLLARWRQGHPGSLPAARPPARSAAHGPLAPAARPLDHHTPSEERDLERILAQRGSR